MAGEASPNAGGGVGPGRRRVAGPIDVVVAGAVVAVLAFPFLASSRVSNLGLDAPGTAPRLPALRRAPSAEVLDVPAFTSGGAAEAAVADGAILREREAMGGALDAASDALFGPGGGGELAGWVQDPLATIWPEVGYPDIVYPYEYPLIDPYLDQRLPQPWSERTASAANDFAGLLVLARARFPDAFPNGAAAAFAILHRARTSSDACLPQLNLAFLLSTDTQPRDDDTALEFERAVEACPGDPTPLYLLGQFQVARAYLHRNEVETLGQELPREERLRRPFGAFRRLREAFPGSPLGWAGEGDAEVRIAMQSVEESPFSARNAFRRALTWYRRAEQLDADPGLAHGEARALAGLGRFGAAAEAERRALDGRTDALVFRAFLVEYLERAGEFGRAAATFESFRDAPGSVPEGPGLIAHAPLEEGGALSWGVDRLQPVVLPVGPPPGGASAGVMDLSFIPDHRPQPGVTGYDRWCGEWAWRRDLILSGRAAEALDGFPDSFEDVRPSPPGDGSDRTCAYGAELLQAVAMLEVGDPDGAIARLREREFLDTSGYEDLADPAASMLFDARQNLWRFAGNLSTAADAADAWVEAEPDDPLALDRRGEIAFLLDDPEEAARWFTRALEAADDRAAIARPPGDFGEGRVVDAQADARVAEELLKLGTSLELAGHHDGALDVLDRTEEAAVAASALFVEEDFYSIPGAEDVVERALLVSYHALAQAADTELRARRYEEAAARYRAAEARERDVLAALGAKIDAEDTSRLLRPEVLQNNHSLVEAKLGRTATAIALAEGALSSDPESPLFLQTLGFARQRAGDLAGAAEAYEAAVRSDPSLFPAANDLGVVLARMGRTDEAVRAFRWAIGANDRYALAWFNLGVVLRRAGPGELLRSEGALSRAVRLDPGLRTRSRTLVYDNDPYFTRLDLSKPLPTGWEFAQAQGRGPLAVSILAILLLSLRLGWTIGKDTVAGKAGRRLLTASFRRGGGWRTLFRRRLPWAVAAAVTAAVFLWPLRGSPGVSGTDVMVQVAGVLVLLAVCIQVRTVVARGAGLGVRQFGWTPAVAFGAATTVLGVGWAPLPALDPQGRSPRLHLAAPIAVGAVTAAALLLAFATGSPALRGVGAAGLVMVASLLTPVRPCDGAFLGRPVLAVAVDVVLIGAAALLFLGLV